MPCEVARRIAAIGGVLLAASAAVQSDPDRSVRIAGTDYLGDLSTLVADQHGFFSAQDLSAKVEYSESDTRNMQRLRAGEVDFALMALTPLVLDRLADPDPRQPDDPVILASLLQSYELTAVLASPDIVRPGDLRGRRVAFERGTDTEFVWWLFEQFHRIDRASVETISMPFSDIAEAMISGRVAATVLPEPWASSLEAMFERSGKARPRRFATQSLYAGRWVLVTTQRFARDRPDLCHDVLASYQRTIRFIDQSPGEAIAIYSAHFDQSEEVLAERWESLDYAISLDWALVADLQQQIHWAQEAGVGQPSARVRVLDLIEPGPLLEAWPTAVDVPVVPATGRSP